MTKYIIIVLINFSVLLGQSYNELIVKDNHGGYVIFPFGAKSFADSIVSFKLGFPPAAEFFSYPEHALGVPNFDEAFEKGYVTLGCGGEIVVKFINNFLIDVEGPDLHIFEVGNNLEPMQVFISKDGDDWIDLGEVKGGKASIDIEKFTEDGDEFYFVKIKDLKQDCAGQWPGADIDAIGAIGAGIKINLEAVTLFEFGEHSLTNSAKNKLDSAIKKIDTYSVEKILINGHTDSVGSEKSNFLLSIRRAVSVKNYLMKIRPNYKYEANGYGSRFPIADNNDEEDRAKNRRVEIIALPK